jgi:hypothetical protein
VKGLIDLLSVNKSTLKMRKQQTGKISIDNFLEKSSLDSSIRTAIENKFSELASENQSLKDTIFQKQ